MRKIRAENLTESAIRNTLATADHAMIVDQMGRPLSVVVSVDQFNLMASSCQLFSSVRNASVNGGGRTSSSEPHTQDLFKWSNQRQWPMKRIEILERVTLCRFFRVFSDYRYNRKSFQVDENGFRAKKSNRKRLFCVIWKIVLWVGKIVW